MKLRCVAAVAAVSLFLVGCSDDEPGGGGPTAGIPGGPTADVPGEPTDGLPAGAPKVANPVANVDKYQQAPCDAIPKAEAAKLGFDTKIELDLAYSEGPSCSFENENGDSFSLVLSKKQPLGIGGIYRNHQQDPEFYEYFEPIDVGGFPGLFVNSIDNRDAGACGLAVGVTDTQIISLVGSVDDTPAVGDVCDLLKRAGEAAVSTMSKG